MDRLTLGGRLLQTRAKPRARRTAAGTLVQDGNLDIDLGLHDQFHSDM